MSRVGNGVAVLLGAAALGVMMSTVPDYNSSFQPFTVSADRNGIGEGRFFKAELLGLQTADVISYAQFDQEISRDTSAVFLIADLSITGRTQSRQLDAVWFGATGRQYIQTTRVQDAPKVLVSARFEPDLTDRVVAIFELPPDEIVGGHLGVASRHSMVGDHVVRFAGPTAMPQKQAVLRLEP